MDETWLYFNTICKKEKRKKGEVIGEDGIPADVYSA